MSNVSWFSIPERFSTLIATISYFYLDNHNVLHHEDSIDTPCLSTYTIQRALFGDKMLVSATNATMLANAQGGEAAHCGQEKPMGLFAQASAAGKTYRPGSWAWTDVRAQSEARDEDKAAAACGSSEGIQRLFPT